MTPDQAGERPEGSGLRGSVAPLRVRDPSKWWRPDGTRPERGESTDGLIVHDPMYRHDDNGELKAVRAFAAAVEAGDYTNLDALAEAASQAEEDARRKAAQKAERDERRRRKAEAQAAAIDRLVDSGMDEAEAESQVTGEPVDYIRKRNYLASKPGWDGTVSGFTKAVKDDWHDEVDRLYHQAEAATNGRMVKRKYEDRIDPMSLWLTDSDKFVREHASEELAAWFDATPNSRPTLAEFRERILGGPRYRREDDYLQ